MKEGADFAAGAVSNWFLTEKQVEEISNIPKEYDKSAQENASYTIAVTILPPKGELLPGTMDITILTLGNHPKTSKFTCNTGTFRQKAGSGPYKIACQSKNMACYISDCIIEPATGDIINLTLQLEKGFPIQIQVVNTENTPIPGAEITITPITANYNSYHSIDGDIYTADTNGIVQFPHANKNRYDIQVKKHGYQLAGQTTYFKENDVLLIQLLASNSNHWKSD